MKSDGGSNSREQILAAATRVAGAHGYGGLNFRDIAAEVGIKAASVYHHFPSKADLGAEVAKRYWEQFSAMLAARLAASGDPIVCLREYPDTFRSALQNGNRMCLCSFMAAEYDDLPDTVKKEVQTFADVNISWLAKVLIAAGGVAKEESEERARAIYAAIAGAQLMARSRSDITIYDSVVRNYRQAGLLPS
ncbi:TetR family transcriptional regulator [Paraburkholderia sp. GV068]|uniref:TetR/AcrR family transcriptional regulator n=1 Tax=unclassified Paraburkholderia TaxID=2615204 RepID=UPI000D2F51C0|nr:MULTISPECIES: TetR/AcrR family transcriptional regulator [unclassified Paraburkholderia]PTQ99098.1 TetR family transcriptional regulator [Paraburkholderia sp. GV072]PUB04590.1 TetR family transcriptional regulator [Paraburkholderia sp. GV068]